MIHTRSSEPQSRTPAFPNSDSLLNNMTLASLLAVCSARLQSAGALGEQGTRQPYVTGLEYLQ